MAVGDECLLILFCRSVRVLLFYNSLFVISLDTKFEGKLDTLCEAIVGRFLAPTLLTDQNCGFPLLRRRI